MAKKTRAGLARRFGGKAGKKRLIDAIKAQVLVGGDAALALELARTAHLKEFRDGTVLITQGAYDNDIFLILSGKVSIQVNGREVATRITGTHVGEMALIDPTAKRSATVVAAESTVAARISEHRFSALATRYPKLWRRIAIEIANRLRERGKFLRTPHAEPLVFVGSSTEGLKVAQEIFRSLRSKPVVPKIWAQGVFEATRTTIESLVALAAEADFGVLVLSPDDLTISRRKKRSSPRDNVIFELGLFVGDLGRDRVIMVKPRGVDIKIPSDLLGITWLEYDKHGPRPLRQRLRTVCRQVTAIIVGRGPR